LIAIGARVTERRARIRIHLPTSCPEGALLRAVALGIMLFRSVSGEDVRPIEPADDGRLIPNALYCELSRNRSNK
jgi:hypothetical protein